MAAGTRSSARLSSSPQSAGNKRKADDTDTSPSSKSKRGRPSKEQKTLEETISKDDDQDAPTKDDQDETADANVGDASGGVEEENGDTKADAGTKANGGVKANDESKDEQAEEGAKNAFDQVKADEREEGKTTAKDDSNHKVNEDIEAGNVKADAVEEDKEREQAMPSNVLEKGLVYFFTRGRVGVTEPGNVTDLQRSFFVLRPLPDGAKLTEGAIQDVGNNRLIALPKKVFPKSGQDRFMVFVEKAATSMDTLKEEFFQGSEYTTQTTGTRQTPEVTPIGEGVYAITTTGAGPRGGAGTTHLAYQLTIPRETGQVQEDVGLSDKGSFIMSVKNPKSSAPSYALPQGAEYPQEIIDEFGGRGWMPAQPKHINYAGASMLLIGESLRDSAALKPFEKDQKDDNKETPEEELDKLENEDEIRVENLSGDDAIFADLGISSKEYPQVKTTW